MYASTSACVCVCVCAYRCVCTYVCIVSACVHVNLQQFSSHSDPHLDHLQQGRLGVGVLQQGGQDHVEEDQLQLHFTQRTNGAEQTQRRQQVDGQHYKNFCVCNFGLNISIRLYTKVTCSQGIFFANGGLSVKFAKISPAKFSSIR